MGHFCVLVGLFVSTLFGADGESDLAEFTRLDRNEDGVLSGTEMKSVRKYDTNSDGEVSREEFLAGRRGDAKPPAEQKTATELFTSKDLNEDGVLSGKEMKGFESLDRDRDGEITLKEFLAGYKGEPKPDPVVTPKPQMDPRLQAWTDQLVAQMDQGSRWAVVIGVNKYEESPLRYCVSDARLIADVLVKNCGLSKEKILVMTDDQPNRHQQPRKAELLTQIPAFLSKVGKRDTVLVFFAGHGMTKDGQSFLCPLDFNPDSSRLTGWRVDELRTMLQDCEAGQKLLILDCCHSGGAVATSGFGANPQELGGAFSSAQGMITFASCRTNQTSLESPERGHGVFSDVLAAGLAGEADFDRNGIVDSDELYRHLLLQVPLAAQEVAPGHKQFPVRIIGQDVVGVFAMGRPDGKLIVDRNRVKPGDIFKNSIGMTLTMLPRGLTVIGSPKNEYLRNQEEQICPVTLARPTIIGVFEVTQGQYSRVMGNNPSWFSASGHGADDVRDLKTEEFPVEQVSWHDAVKFCDTLSRLPAEQEAGRRYRLPTEVEREYACRAGTFTPFHTGELISPREANIRGDRPYLNSPKGESLGRTTPVGAYPPNSFGLYDMHGNVAEWVIDRFDSSNVYVELPNSILDAKDVLQVVEDILSTEKVTRPLQFPINPIGTLRGEPRISRGGSFSGDVSLCRSAARREQDCNFVHKTVGFRVVCEIVK
jgi:formylglycine-generating enzyme required for sulfatase activity